MLSLEGCVEGILPQGLSSYLLGCDLALWLWFFQALGYLLHNVTGLIY